MFPDRFRVDVFGRWISQYIINYMEKGVADPSILTIGFDLNMYNNKRKAKTPKVHLVSLSSFSLSVSNQICISLDH